MASFGLFGSSAPRIRRLQPMGAQFAPSIEELQAQQAAQMQAQPEEIMPTRSGGIKLGAFGQGPTNPAPAAAKPEPQRGPSASYLPEPAPVAAKKYESNPLLDAFGYDAQNAGMGGLEWWMSSPQQRDQSAAQIAAQRAAQRTSAAQQAQIGALRQAGYGEDQIIAFLNNPEKWSESLATGIEATNVEGGNSRYTGGANGKFITAPKLGVDGGYGYSQTPEGTTWGNQRGASYAEKTDAGTLAETGRHNRAQEGIDATRVANDALKTKNNPTGLTDEQVKTEIALSKDWGNVASEWQNVANMSERARTMGARKDSVGDLQLVIALTKLADPGTAAREGEVQMSQQTASLVDQASNWIEKLKEGNTLLPDSSRAAMLQAINEMEGVYTNFYEGVGERTKQRAEAYGFDPQRVFLTMQPKSMRAPEKPKPTVAQQGIDAIGGALKDFGGMFMQPGRAQPQQAAPVRINSPQERDALPPGTPYVAPDGSVKIKR